MNPLDAPIRTLDDLAAAWRVIDGGHGYSAPQQFFLLLDKRDRLMAEIIQVYDSETAGVPDDLFLGLLCDRLAERLDVLGTPGSVAAMRARPGSAAVTDLDRRWFRALHHHLGAAPFGTRPLFFAAGGQLGPVPPDDLVAVG